VNFAFIPKISGTNSAINIESFVSSDEYGFGTNNPRIIVAENGAVFLDPGG